MYRAAEQKLVELLWPTIVQISQVGLCIGQETTGEHESQSSCGTISTCDVDNEYESCSDESSIISVANLPPPTLEEAFSETWEAANELIQELPPLSKVGSFESHIVQLQRNMSEILLRAPHPLELVQNLSGLATQYEAIPAMHGRMAPSSPEIGSSIEVPERHATAIAEEMIIMPPNWSAQTTLQPTLARSYSLPDSHQFKKTSMKGKWRKMHAPNPCELAMCFRNWFATRTAASPFKTPMHTEDPETTCKLDDISSTLALTLCSSAVGSNEAEASVNVTEHLARNIVEATNGRTPMKINKAKTPESEKEMPQNCNLAKTSPRPNLARSNSLPHSHRLKKTTWKGKWMKVHAPTPLELAVTFRNLIATLTAASPSKISLLREDTHTTTCQLPVTSSNLQSPTKPATNSSLRDVHANEYLAGTITKLRNEITALNIEKVTTSEAQGETHPNGLSQIRSPPPTIARSNSLPDGLRQKKRSKKATTPNTLHTEFDSKTTVEPSVMASKFLARILEWGARTLDKVTTSKPKGEMHPTGLAQTPQRPTLAKSISSPDSLRRQKFLKKEEKLRNVHAPTPFGLFTALNSLFATRTAASSPRKCPRTEDTPRTSTLADIRSMSPSPGTPAFVPGSCNATCTKADASVNSSDYLAGTIAETTNESTAPKMGKVTTSKSKGTMPPIGLTQTPPPPNIARVNSLPDRLQRKKRSKKAKREWRNAPTPDELAMSLRSPSATQRASPSKKSPKTEGPQTTGNLVNGCSPPNHTSCTDTGTKLIAGAKGRKLSMGKIPDAINDSEWTAVNKDKITTLSSNAEIPQKLLDTAKSKSPPTIAKSNSLSDSPRRKNRSKREKGKKVAASTQAVVCQTKTVAEATNKKGTIDDKEKEEMFHKSLSQQRTTIARSNSLPDPHKKRSMKQRKAKKVRDPLLPPLHR